MKTKIYLTALVAVALSSCASTESRVSYSGVAKEYQELLLDEPAPVEFPVEAACNDKGQCIVNESRMEDLREFVSKRNAAVAKWYEAYKNQLDATMNCDYANRVQQETIEYQDQLSFREQVMHGVKQALTVTTCGILLLH